MLGALLHDQIRELVGVDGLSCLVRQRGKLEALVLDVKIAGHCVEMVAGAAIQMRTLGKRENML